MSKFYRLKDDLHIPNRWHLGAPISDEGCDPDDLVRGVEVNVRSAPNVEVKLPGVPLDFTLTGFDVPVVSPRIAKLFAGPFASDIQMIPVRVGDHDGYEIINITRVIRCLDERRSVFTKWTEKDGRPDRTGRYRMVTRLRINAASVPSSTHIFRVDGWIIPIIVSHELMEAITSLGGIGAVFEQVTADA